MMIASTASNRNDVGKLILRLMVGALMLFHGVSKLRHGVGFVVGQLHVHHLPSFLSYGVYIGEVAAPVLLILGIFARPAALVIIVDMVMALFLVMQGRIFALQPQGGGLGAELQFLYLFSALAIAFLGSGRFAISKGRGRWD